ncbi:unnamed protein product, partial [Iphiclides podalirius]
MLLLYNLVDLLTLESVRRRKPLRDSLTHGLTSPDVLEVALHETDDDSSARFAGNFNWEPSTRAIGLRTVRGFLRALCT